MDPRKGEVGFSLCVSYIFVVVAGTGDVSDRNLRLTAASLTEEMVLTREWHPFPVQSMALLFCLSFRFACLLSAKPLPDKD